MQKGVIRHGLRPCKPVYLQDKTFVTTHRTTRYNDICLPDTALQLPCQPVNRRYTHGL